MSAIHTTLVTDAHGYTRERSPWIIDDGDGKDSVCGKLVRYLSGGGIRTLGRTVSQEIARRKQRRFLFFAAGLAALWMFFRFA